MNPLVWQYLGYFCAPLVTVLGILLFVKRRETRRARAMDLAQTFGEWQLQDLANLCKQYAIGVDAGIGEEHGAAVVIRLGENGAPDESVEELGLTTLGELPTGEYRATVRIAEGYTEGAKQQAESDGVSLEDWLTIQLNAYLEQWWFANGPR